MLIEPDSLVSYLTWNHKVGAYSFSHTYKDIPDLDFFHTSLNEEENELEHFKMLIKQVVDSIESMDYKIRGNIIRGTAELVWLQIRMIHGDVDQIEGMVETMLENGMSHVKHIFIDPTDWTRMFAHRIHSTAYKKAGLSAPPKPETSTN